MLNVRGDEKLAFSTNISRYFENDTWYGHNYSGRRTETRMRSNGAISSDLEWPLM